MSKISYNYQDTVEVTSTNSGAAVLAEILEFKPKNTLSVSVNRQIKIIMKYDETKGQYLGRTGNLEFMSHGPKEIITTQKRRG